MSESNWAGRAGRWAAENWKKAFVGWLLDATIIRAVLLPSTMKLLGEWNWYLPRWLEWMPSLSPEGREKVPEAPQVAPLG